MLAKSYQQKLWFLGKKKVEHQLKKGLKLLLMEEIRLTT